MVTVSDATGRVWFKREYEVIRGLDAAARGAACTITAAALPFRSSVATRRGNRTAPRTFDRANSEHRRSRWAEHLLLVKFNGS